MVLKILQQESSHLALCSLTLVWPTLCTSLNSVLETNLGSFGAPKNFLQLRLSRPRSKKISLGFLTMNSIASLHQVQTGPFCFSLFLKCLMKKWGQWFSFVEWKVAIQSTLRVQRENFFFFSFFQVSMALPLRINASQNIQHWKRPNLMLEGHLDC